jgi:hypothetical protein
VRMDSVRMLQEKLAAITESRVNIHSTMRSAKPCDGPHRPTT